MGGKSDNCRISTFSIFDSICYLHLFSSYKKNNLFQDAEHLDVLKSLKSQKRPRCFATALPTVAPTRFAVSNTHGIFLIFQKSTLASLIFKGDEGGWRKISDRPREQKSLGPPLPTSPPPSLTLPTFIL